MFMRACGLRPDGDSAPDAPYARARRKFMIKLKVNGKNHQFNGDPDIPLLWVLRDELDLRGMEFVTWTALQPLWSNL
jgi:hypothetical protein